MSLPTNARMFAGRLDVAPFASVFFLLLIFLLLMTHLAPVPGVPVDLPDAELPDAVAGPDWLVVVMDGAGRTYFNQQIITDERLREELTARLQSAGTALPLVLQADAGVPLEDLVRFYALCRSAGIGKVKLQTRAPLHASRPRGWLP
ncbi:MAG: biopolymer transporter ExbD [Verrucomicrobia bacterium]|nr:biopolymer transporter ExbD [Verrucomicrobiota bacterium]